MRNLAQKAREGRLSALQQLAERSSRTPKRNFGSVVCELDRIVRDPRFSSMSSGTGLGPNSLRYSSRLTLSKSAAA